MRAAARQSTVGAITDGNSQKPDGFIVAAGRLRAGHSHPGVVGETQTLLFQPVHEQEGVSWAVLGPLLEKGLLAGTAPLFHLGATQGYGIIQQL